MRRECSHWAYCPPATETARFLVRKYLADSRGEVAFLIAAPLVWAVVLVFHPAPDPDDVYASLRDEADRMVMDFSRSSPACRRLVMIRISPCRALA